jgi:hypothetical protein
MYILGYNYSGGFRLRKEQKAEQKRDYPLRCEVRAETGLSLFLRRAAESLVFADFHMPE